MSTKQFLFLYKLHIFSKYYFIILTLVLFVHRKPDIVVSFDGVETSNLQNAAANMNVKTIHAKVQPGSCGLFNFEETIRESDLSSPRLENDPDNTALILRTSGTTSEPKVCALKMCSIVSNSRIIANNLGLKPDDVALNAMPLFHIGGLSANLLSSLAAGASVILMPKFDVEEFFQTLQKKDKWAQKRCVTPEPTWFSAVPTMHAGKMKNGFLLSKEKFEKCRRVHKISYSFNNLIYLPNSSIYSYSAICRIFR